jgi:excisionase family DNA binding protein
MEQFVTITQAAELLEVSGARVHQLIDAGFLQVAGVAGKTKLLRRADVEWLARHGWPGRRTRRESD